MDRLKYEVENVSKDTSRRIVNKYYTSTCGPAGKILVLIAYTQMLPLNAPWRIHRG